MDYPTFASAIAYLELMPCALKNVLFNGDLRPMCCESMFVGRILPIRNMETGKLVGDLQEVIVVDTKTQNYVKSLHCYSDSHSRCLDFGEDTNFTLVKATCNIVLENLKKQGYTEVRDEIER